MEHRFKSDEWKNLTAAQRARRCRLIAAEARALAEGASPHLKLAYIRIAENWIRLAEDVKEASIDPPSVAQPGRPRLKTSDARAIAEFLNGGGRIARVMDSVPATEQEVIQYLATCGVEVKSLRGNLKGYWCNGRACTVSALVRLANEYRRAQKLAPFAIRLNPAPRKK
jgi:hypothetical protein